MMTRCISLLIGLLMVAECSAFLPRHGTFTNGRLALEPTITLEARRRNRSSEEDASASDSSNKEIPQLPSFGSSSFDAAAAVQRKISGEDSPDQALMGRKMQLQYTCKVCETRNVHKVSRIAYQKGVVITVCKGCMSQHLISDNLGFTQQFDGNLEDYFKEQGSEESVQRVSKDVFNLEKIMGVDTTSGSILGEDGTAQME
ncbi:DNL-type zinc finger protein [Seminavis robusta]|uniref:DNL-type zinc finger protein n=1 Tax=Seminavis robusta TaxID=568900 RepID=A0A9N8EEK4_9STRA|nr:DNL-type zinc finger protein [Seminavis robusta]|eukprot:Sro979_g227270.1 DNL-type zinc finger protein (201) ;mRNA; f:23356-24049